MDDILEIFKNKNPEQMRDVKGYDDLAPDEQQSYFEMLKVIESNQISLEDFKKYIHRLRQGIELEVAQMLPTDPRFPMYQARQYVYILFESFFERPQRARQMIESLALRRTK